MWTKDKLEDFMKSFGFKPNMTRPEIKELPSLLHPDEQLCGLLEGELKRIHNRDYNGNGLVIATNKRIIFFRKSFIGTVTKEEIPVPRVSSISFRKGLIFSSVTITTASNDSVVENCDKATGKKFSDVVQSLISDLASRDNTGESHRAASPPDHLAQLEKLFGLKEKGILTEEEYLAQKAKLLGS